MKYTGNSDVETDTIGNVRQQIHEAEAEAQSELSAKIGSINLILETILPYLVGETERTGSICSILVAALRSLRLIFYSVIKLAVKLDAALL